MKSPLLCAVMAVAHASPSDLPRGVVLDPSNKFGIQGGHQVPVEWDLPAFKDGPILTLNGTVQEVHKRLLEINPNYNADFKMFEPRSTDMEKRTDFSNANTLCSASIYGVGDIGRMWTGVNYLYTLVGRPKNGGGPGACGLVSCSGYTGIWWCNDSPEPKRLNGWNSIADGAQKIWGVCSGQKKYGYQNWEVSGQVFHPTDWNVIIRETTCD